MVKVCVLRAPGTNCDAEAKEAVEHFKVKAEVVHVNELIKKEKKLSDYDALVIPGGFSFGDHVRAGALLGGILREKFRSEIEKFNEEEKPILGICNGFQILAECGIFENTALLPNSSARFEDRWVYLKKGRSRCIFTKEIPPLTRMPVAHGEGRFTAGEKAIEKIKKENLIAFSYAREDGRTADGEYPLNPNGSADDMAGITNPKGNVLGLMPHPERAFFKFMYPDWTREKAKNNGGSKTPELCGDGYYIFKSMTEYIKK